MCHSPMLAGHMYHQPPVLPTTVHVSKAASRIYTHAMHSTYIGLTIIVISLSRELICDPTSFLSAFYSPVGLSNTPCF
jgi:hypothetical protein